MRCGQKIDGKPVYARQNMRAPLGLILQGSWQWIFETADDYYELLNYMIDATFEMDRLEVVVSIC
jgi:hypothetical protein